MSKYYVVWKGRKSGIYTSWEQCSAQVSGYPGAQYKAFDSRQEAERAFRRAYEQVEGKPASRDRWLFSPAPPVAESYAVDAACSGSPGDLEYQGVHTRTGKELFHRGPYENGTNNIGEFLAIVEALRLLHEKGVSVPIYSDSGTAIAWVRRKKCATTLQPDGRNAQLFRLIHQAEEWLAQNRYTNAVLKWDTPAWGENPADFNRK